MKILEVNKFFYLRRGAERHVLDLLDALGRRGHETAVFAMRHPENIFSPFANFFPKYVGYNADDADIWQRLIGIGRLFWSFEARRKMDELLAKWQPDIVHLHNIYHQLSPSIIGPIKKRGLPIVMTVHDYNLISPDKDIYHPEVGRRYWKFLFVSKYGVFKRLLLVLKTYWNEWFHFYADVDLFIVPSRFVKDVFVSAGMEKKKIVVMPHFITASEKTVVDDKEEVARETYALYFGSLSEEKGINDLVALFDSLHIPLLLVGAAENGFSLRESPYVSAVGRKTKTELADLVRGAACVVSASRLPETFGLIALESIALGKPFFGLRRGAYGEIIENGKNGFLGENEAELKRYLEDFFAGRYAFSVQAIRTSAEECFGEERYMKVFESLCESLIDKE